MDVIEEETTEDFSKMAAVAPSDDSYFKTSVFTHAKNRIAMAFDTYAVSYLRVLS